MPMKRFYIGMVLYGLGMSISPGVLTAQATGFTFDAGAGFTTPVQHLDSRTNYGYNIMGRAGYNFTPRFGLLGEFSYNELGLSPRFLATAGTPGGDIHTYSATLQPMVHFKTGGRWGFYVTGGGGYYRRTFELTAPSVAQATIFDPFFGFFYPVVVPVTQVVASRSQNKGGLNIGAGTEIRLSSGSRWRLFGEARYQYIYTSPRGTSFLPVTFGIRW
jgi:opacity protein-like surface antigen